MDNNDLATLAFKLVQGFDRRMSRIEALAEQLVQDKELREAMVQGIADLKQHSEALKNAFPKA
jgi:hypothetical protein